MRIVSCVPSLTEWIWDLGASNDLVGRTKFCVHPDSAIRKTPQVGGTKSLKVEAIAALQPDLVIANREENIREQIEACAEFCPVLLTDIRTVQGAWEEMQRIADAVGYHAEGKAWIARIQDAWGPQKPLHRKVAYCVWRDPLMVAGGDTFISDVLNWWGMANAFGHLSRYPEVTSEMLLEADVEEVLLPSEPFPFKVRHQSEFSLPNRLVDGEAFSWYGSRMWHARGQLRQIVG